MRRWPDDLLTGLLVVGVLAFAVAEVVCLAHAFGWGAWGQ